MTLNPNTFINLYNQGIIDAVPMDLIGPVAYNHSANSYMNMAQSGNLYQNAVNGSDMFVQSSPYGAASGIGMQNPFAVNSSSSAMNIGFDNGMYSQNTLGQNGMTFTNPYANIKSESQLEPNMPKSSKIGSFFSAIPMWVKGVASGLIVLGTIIFPFMRKKKPSKDAVKKAVDKTKETVSESKNSWFNNAKLKIKNFWSKVKSKIKIKK